MKRRIRKELLDELLADYKGPEDLTGPEGLLKQLTGALVERALGAELTEHLGYEPGAPGSAAAGNARNGTTSKTLTAERGNVVIETPRDRSGTFEPQLVPLDAIWPIIYLDTIVLKVRDQGVAQNKHVYLAMGINDEGKKDGLGIWMEPNEGARF